MLDFEKPSQVFILGVITTMRLTVNSKPSIINTSIIGVAVLNYLLRWLERHDRKRIIMDRINDQPYLERYYVFLKDRTRFPFNVFLHRFLQSDPDDVHDHPWPYFTVILKGGYTEWIPQFNKNGQKTAEIAAWRGPGHFRFSSANSYHRIEIDPDVETWTLFVPGPKQRDWGFLTRTGWVESEQYLAQRAQP